MIVVLTLVTACGGGSGAGTNSGQARGSARPTTIFIQPSCCSAVSTNGSDMQMQPQDDSNAARSVHRQSLLEGSVILWLGKNKAIDNFDSFTAEATKYPNKFALVYLYDELFWCGTSACIGHDEKAVLHGASIAHARGFKTMCTMLPDVILHPDFTMANINMCDLVTIDVYPSIRPTAPDFGACSFSNNHLENLFFCSVKKLRKMGFMGDAGYIYQGFGLRSEPESTLLAHLALQRQAISHASAMGADAIGAWGLHIGPPELAQDPDLFQLSGTKFESEVQP